jgi:MGT family glycosyltransferase
VTYLAAKLFGAGWAVQWRNLFVRDAEVTLRRLPPLLEPLQADGLVWDQLNPAAGSVAEHLGMPHATICVAVPWHEDPTVPPQATGLPYSTRPSARLRYRLSYAGWRWFTGAMVKTINRFRRQWNLAPLGHIDQVFSPLAQISQLLPEFDYPRRRLPPCFHYVGSLSSCRPAAPDDFPWEKLDGRPIVFASLGTTNDGTNWEVYRRIVEACEELPAQLVLSFGRVDQDDEHREPIRKLARKSLVVDFVPQLAMLQRAAVMITHAGGNSTAECLAHGVPMLALPRNADQPGLAQRIVQCGAGLRGSMFRSSAAELRELLRRLLSEESFRLRAQAMQRANAAAGGAARAAGIIEEAFATRRPVLRDAR